MPETVEIQTARPADSSVIESSPVDFSPTGFAKANLLSGDLSTAVLFLNFFAFGSIAPLLYYIISLPDSIWVGLLFLFDAIGRVASEPLLYILEKNLGRRVTSINLQATAILAYSLLSFTEHVQISPLLLIYMSIFLLAMVRKSAASGRLLSGRISSDSISMMGFAAGCLLAMLGNNHRVPGSILMMDGLHRPAQVAAAISEVALLLTIFGRTPERERLKTGHNPNWIIALLSNAGFGMTLCVLPLTAWESYRFHPATIGLYLACLATLRELGRTLAQRFASISDKFLCAIGCFITATGFFGFVVALSLTWITHPIDGMKVGYAVLWISVVPAALGHGILRDAFVRADRLRLPALPEIVFGISAVFASSIWLQHERTSLAMPCLLMAIATVVSFQNALSTRLRAA